MTEAIQRYYGLRLIKQDVMGVPRLLRDRDEHEHPQDQADDLEPVREVRREGHLRGQPYALFPTPELLLRPRRRTDGLRARIPREVRKVGRAEGSLGQRRPRGTEAPGLRAGEGGLDSAAPGREDAPGDREEGRGLHPAFLLRERLCRSQSTSGWPGSSPGIIRGSSTRRS